MPSLMGWRRRAVGLGLVGHGSVSVEGLWSMWHQAGNYKRALGVTVGLFGVTLQCSVVDDVTFIAGRVWLTMGLRWL